MEIDELLDQVGKRLPRKKQEVLPPKETVPEAAPTDEDNQFRAATGLRFKCGVCNRTHAPKGSERAQILSGCTFRIVKHFGSYREKTKSHLSRSRRGKKFYRNSSYKVYGNKEVPTGVGVQFIPRPGDPESVRFTYREVHVLASAWPSNEIFTRTQPTLRKRYADATKRAADTEMRTLTEDVSMREALGAPNTFQYLRDIQDRFEKQARKDYKVMVEAHKGAVGSLLKRLEKWRGMRPEKWELKDLERFEVPFVRGEGLMPLRVVKLNGVRMDASDLTKCFKMVGPKGVAFSSDWHNSDPELRVLDVGLRRGYPALSWSYDFYRGASKKKVATRIHFLSTWRGDVYLNLTPNYYGEEGTVLVKDLDTKNLAKLVPTKEEGDLFEGPEEDTV